MSTPSPASVWGLEGGTLGRSDPQPVYRAYSASLTWRRARSPSVPGRGDSPGGGLPDEAPRRSGLIGGGKTDKEVKFILDGDFSTAGKRNPDAVPEKLERMHRFAVCLFQGAITKELHEAMGPTPLAE